MISVLLFVFLLQLTIYLINTIGKQTINDLLWNLFTHLPIPQAQEALALTQLRRDVVRLQREMSATSAQDEFAKWAKLRRQHDKVKEEYDTRAKSHASFRSTFDRIISVLRWLGTQGLQFLCNFYFAKQALFWLPRGWVPYTGEWILSLPRAPLGSVSVNVWSMACASVVALVGEAVLGIWTLRQGSVTVGGDGLGKEGRKVPLDSGAFTGEKKEL